MIPTKIGTQPIDSVLGLNIAIELIDCQIFVILGILGYILGVSILIIFVARMLFCSFS